MTMTPGMEADIELSARLAAQFGAQLDALGSLTALMRAREDRAERLSRAVRYLPNAVAKAAAVTAGSVTNILPETDFQPKKGWAWAVQRITANGLSYGTGAGTPPDTLTIWRGSSAADVGPGQNMLNTISTNTQTWHPGRTGLVLQFPERLLFSEFSQTGSPASIVYVSADVIMVEEEFLPDFLL
jgi:hypothetical protein